MQECLVGFAVGTTHPWTGRGIETDTSVTVSALLTRNYLQLSLIADDTSTDD